MTGTKITRQFKPWILIATLTAIVTTVACSSKAKPTVVTMKQPASVIPRPDAPKSVAFTTQTTPLQVAEKSPAKQLKAGVFKSHDYGVSFEYPWQYTRLGAKAVADDYSLQPESDGLDSQFTLVRIDVPKGFYPDTDFDSGYFILSLNPELGEKECQETLGKDAKPQISSINGFDFRWMENESGGHGASRKVRDYVAFANDTCYEIELGVKTKNDGLSREIDPEQVMHRLDAILATVKIVPDERSGAKQQILSSTQGQTDAGR